MSLKLLICYFLFKKKNGSANFTFVVKIYLVNDEEIGDVMIGLSSTFSQSFAMMVYCLSVGIDIGIGVLIFGCVHVHTFGNAQ